VAQLGRSTALHTAWSSIMPKLCQQASRQSAAHTERVRHSPDQHVYCSASTAGTAHTPQQAQRHSHQATSQLTTLGLHPSRLISSNSRRAMSQRPERSQAEMSEE
jgi:hypothetical protein